MVKKLRDDTADSSDADVVFDEEESGPTPTTMGPMLLGTAPVEPGTKVLLLIIHFVPT